MGHPPRPRARSALAGPTRESGNASSSRAGPTCESGNASSAPGPVVQPALSPEDVEAIRLPLQVSRGNGNIWHQQAVLIPNPMHRRLTRALAATT